MVKRTFKIICILMLNFALIITPSFAATGTVTGTNVRIRERADSKALEVSVATKNETVEVIGEEGDWYKVKFETVTGYISKDYVDTDYSSEGSSTLTSEPDPEPEPEPQPQPETTPDPEPEHDPEPQENEPSTSEPETQVEPEQTVTFENETDLKYLPSFTSRNSAKVTSGSTYTVKATLNNWIKVVNDTNSGWVLKSSVSGTSETNPVPDTSEPAPSETTPTESTPTETPSTPTDTAQKGTVNVESARIRRSPDGETLDSIEEGTEVTILGEENGWYHISVGEYNSCYIAKRLITEK